MTKINVIFDGVYDDADIIAIPDKFESEMEEIGQKFVDWLPNSDKDDPDYWTIINGKKCNIAETVGFIKWFNFHYCFNMEKAYIVSANTFYNPQYKILEF